MNFYFITGTSRGLGKGLAEVLLSSEENRVIGVSRSKTIEHERYKHIAVDLLNLDEVEKELSSIFSTDERPSSLVLINNAGILGEMAYSGELSSRKVEDVFKLNVTVPAVLMNEFIRIFADVSVDKTILNISSGAARNEYDGWSNYCASKAALDMLSKVIAVEQKIKGNPLKIYSAAPGVVESAMHEQIRSTNQENFSAKGKFLNMKANDLLMSPQDAAKKLLYLIDNSSDYPDVIQDVRDFVVS
ncbi:SDR family NAD(P)-dependent oxidoreductase [Xanthovirga aplysinae]|uniref:SDR family NAD(P)-dependent oxidoreductase n=1 Tax=Xanthovirga aplysinae TaxID=2529853 RepID=UPI0012BC4855|nr:SDR family NAD(P)-dependent oxidoreductase [Xanthovirga aplysinae]MTI31047.1 SDR family NAD(P)-dependent oxidoreductase [Xanthovirga aplysinae]